MQKKKDKLLNKIVKKDYNNRLEEILEKKYFDSSVKSLLLSMLYKIETAYNDYEKVKQNVESKEEYLNNIIDIIKNDCDTIKTVKPYSEESKIIGDRTFLVEKNKKRIICYPIERKLLYSIAKIGKKDKIVKGDFTILNQTMSDLINVGNSINMVEPLRDFNGYSWTTIPREIESIQHNLIYQNLRILVGYSFLNNWTRNKEFIIDYMELFKSKLEDKYGKKMSEKIIELIKKISIVLDVKFNSKIKENVKLQKKDIENRMAQIESKTDFTINLTDEKKKIASEIGRIDEIINNKNLLQEEYENRNKDLPLQQKIFSVKILSQKLREEREEKIQELEELNNLLNPKNFVKYKKTLEYRYKYLNIRENANTLIEKLQKIFIECFKIKIKKTQTRQDLIKHIYEFRYYNLLPYQEDKYIKDVKELQDKLNELQNIIIEKADELKIIEEISKNKEVNYEIVKNIFSVRIINLEELYIKIVREKDKYFIQIFDGDAYEDKVEIQSTQNIEKKNLQIRTNKKIRLLEI